MSVLQQIIKRNVILFSNQGRSQSGGHVPHSKCYLALLSTKNKKFKISRLICIILVANFQKSLSAEGSPPLSGEF